MSTVCCPHSPRCGHPLKSYWPTRGHNLTNKQTKQPWTLLLPTDHIVHISSIKGWTNESFIPCARRVTALIFAGNTHDMSSGVQWSCPVQKILFIVVFLAFGSSPSLPFPSSPSPSFPLPLSPSFSLALSVILLVEFSFDTLCTLTSCEFVYYLLSATQRNFFDEDWGLHLCPSKEIGI